MIPIIEQAKQRLGSDVGTFAFGEYRSTFVGVPPSVIMEAEAYLGLSLPNDYTTFVEAYGGLLIGAIWIYGICDTDFGHPMICDGVRATRDARDTSDLPQYFYVVADEEGDEYHCIDCRAEASGTVVAWGTYEQSVIRHLAPSFHAYLEERVMRVLGTRP